MNSRYPGGAWLVLVALMTAAGIAGPEPERESISSESPGAGDSLLARADRHWHELRYDLAADEFAAASRRLSPGPRRERAGVMAARSLLELGRRDEALAAFEAVASADSGGYWWGRALYYSVKHAPFLFPGRRGQDSLEVAAQRSERRARIFRARDLFRRGAEADSLWLEALNEVEVELLPHHSEIDELDRSLEESLPDAVTKEQEASLWMSYVEGLDHVRSRAFLPENRRRVEQARDERVRRALEHVVNELGETSHGPTALKSLADRSYPDRDRRRDLLVALAERYPDSREAVEVASELERLLKPELELACPQKNWASGDSIRIRITLRNLPLAEVTLLRLDLEDVKERLLPDRPPPRRTAPRADGTPLRRWRMPGLPLGERDTTLVLQLSQGFYACRTDAPARSPEVLFSVTDLYIYEEASRADSVGVLLVSSDARPVPGAQVDVYHHHVVDVANREARLDLIGTLQSGSDGRVNVPFPEVTLIAAEGTYDEYRGSLLLVAHKGDDADVRVVRLPSWSQTRSLVWTDRPIYRPGEIVHFQGVLLRGPASQWTPAAEESLEVHAMLPGVPPALGPHPGRWDSIMVTDRFGSVHGAFIIPEDAADGDLSIDAWRLDPRRASSGGTKVRVAAFERLDFDMDVGVTNVEPMPGDTIVVRVRAETANGMPLAAARLTGSAATVRMIRTYETHGNTTAQGWYGPVVERPARAYRSRFEEEMEVATFDLLPDSEGRASLRIPTQPLAGDFTTTFDPIMIDGLVIDLTLDDGAGRRQARSVEVPLFPGRAWCVEGGRYGGPDYLDRFVMVRRLDNRNRAAPGSIHYRWVDRVPDLANDRYDERVLESGSLVTEGDGTAVLAPPPGSDPFHLALDVWAEENARRATRIGYRPEHVWPAELTITDTTWSRGRERWIQLDHLQYAIGDTALVRLAPDLLACPGVLRAGQTPVRLCTPGSDTVIALPILARYVPETFVSYEPVHRPPGCSSATGRLVVEPRARLLGLDIDLDREAYGPGDSVEVRVRARDSEDRLVEAVVSVAAVDEAVFAIREDEIDIERHFFWLSKGYITSAMSVPSAPPPVPPARVAFRPTAFWIAGAVTDPRTGEVLLRAPLPDDLARWRLTVRAVGVDGRVGQARVGFESLRMIRLRPRLPRFARVGDSFGFSLLLDNHSDRNASFRVSWSGGSMRAESPTARPLDVAAGASGEARFEATATSAGVDSLVLLVEGADSGDRIHCTLPVQSPGLSVPPSAAERQRALSLTLADVLAGVRRTLKERLESPYAYAPEATLHLLLRLGEGAELLAPGGSAEDLALAPTPELTARLHEALEWRARWSERVVSELSLHDIADVARHLVDLEEAAKRGWWVDSTSARSRTTDWLAEVIANPILAPDERAAAVLALKALGRPVAAEVDRVRETPRLLSPGGRAMLAMAIADEDLAMAANLIASAAALARFDPDSTYGSFDIRRPVHPEWRLGGEESAPLVLQALERIDPASRVLEPLTNTLVLERASAGWPVDWQTGLVLGALLELTRSPGAEAPGAEPLNHPRPDSGELRLDRRLGTGGSGAGSAGAGNPDTVTCTVGDTLRVVLTIHTLLALQTLEVTDPVPAGCQALRRGDPEFLMSLREQIRDDEVRISTLYPGRFQETGQTVVEHLLLAERPGVFQMPAARIYPSRLPALEARSHPLVLRIID